MTQSSTPTSAKDFRSDMRQMQVLSSQISLLINIGLYINEHGLGAETYTQVLEEICRYTTLEHGLIAVEVAGVYKVKVSQGGGLLKGSRIPSSVTSNLVFLPHQPIRMHEQSHHRLWSIPPESIKTEWLIPIKIGAQAIGFIALASATPTPALNDAQIKVMQTVASILGLALQPNASTPQTQDLEAIALLTAREKEVFALIPLGLSNAEIGEKLGISAGTAKIHVERILSKLGLSDRTQAAVKATKMGYTS